MKIILTDIQYNTLKEMTEESLRNFLYKLWDTQKKRGEEPSLDDIIYQVTEIGRDTREDYSTIRPIWYRYNGGFNKLFKKLKDEILNKTFDLVVPEIGLNTKVEVIDIESAIHGSYEVTDLFCNVDDQGVIDFYMYDDETDEEMMVNDTIEGAYMEALSAYETGDLTGAINYHVYEFFSKKLEKYGIPIDTEIELVNFEDNKKINESYNQTSENKNLNAIKKYWKKQLEKGNKIRLDNSELEYWGLSDWKDKRDAQEIFQELVGGETFAEEVIKGLINKRFSTNDFSDDIVGGYDFSFKLINYEYRDYEFFIWGELIPGGHVSLMDGRYMSLKDALDDDDISWEIQQEINDLVEDCISSILFPITGKYANVPMVYIIE